MTQSFLTDLTNDLKDNFFNSQEFGEVVTLQREGEKFTLNALFDSQSIDGENLGIELESISHRPRLFVRSFDLPNGKPKKGDVFFISASEFHEALTLKAVDFAFEKDGTVVYKLTSKGI